MSDDKAKEQMASIAWMVAQPAWQTVFLPNISGLLNQDMVALSLTKRGELTDDFLRGRIAVYRWLIEGIPARLEEFAREQEPQTENPDGQPVGHPYGSDNPVEEL